MNNKLKKFLEKNSKYKMEEFVGYLPFIILSKDIFVKNSDIAIFFEKNLNIVLKQYIYSSRTLILSKLIRYIFDLPEDRQLHFIQLFCTSSNEILKKKEAEGNESDKQAKKTQLKKTRKDNGSNALANWLNNLNTHSQITPDDLLEK